MRHQLEHVYPIKYSKGYYNYKFNCIIPKVLIITRQTCNLSKNRFQQWEEGVAVHSRQQLCTEHMTRGSCYTTHSWIHYITTHHPLKQHPHEILLMHYLVLFSQLSQNNQGKACLYINVKCREFINSNKNLFNVPTHQCSATVKKFSCTNEQDLKYNKYFIFSCSTLVSGLIA